LISEYRATPGIDALLPRSQHGCQTLLELFLLERSLIDLGHELRARPDWVRIALDSVSELLGE
jgi:predicted trehalose synthase